MHRSEMTLPLICAAIFSLVAVICRLIPHEYNFVAFGGLALFCGCFLRGWALWLVPLAAYLSSEVLGRLNGMPGMSLSLVLWVMAGYGFSIIAGRTSRSFLASMPRQLEEFGKRAVGVAIVSVVGSLGFFLITNFASWLDPMMSYPRTIGGLFQAYSMGLPFHRWTLVSDLVFGLVFFGSYYVLGITLPAQRTSDARSN